MAWDVEYTDTFAEWWRGISEEEQEDIAFKVKLLERVGPALGRPHADSLAKQSQYPNMKELRIVHGGDRTAFSSLSIRGEWRYSFWVDARRTKNGTRPQSQQRTSYMEST